MHQHESRTDPPQHMILPLTELFLYQLLQSSAHTLVDVHLSTYSFSFEVISCEGYIDLIRSCCIFLAALMTYSISVSRHGKTVPLHRLPRGPFITK